MIPFMISNGLKETFHDSSLIHTHSITGAVGVHLFEATAVEALLHIPLCALRVVPPYLQQVVLQHTR